MQLQSYFAIISVVKVDVEINLFYAL